MNVRTRIRLWLVVTFAVGAGLLAWAVATNFCGLRVALYLDNRIHSTGCLTDGMVIQRADSDHLTVEVCGRVGWLSRTVEVAVVSVNRDSISPTNWMILDGSPSWTRFRGRLSLSRGWNQAFIRGRAEGTRVTSLRVGVGDVFLVAGQSNASGGCQTLFLAATDDVRCGQLEESGILVWKRGDDPYVNNCGGSVWPLVGSRLAKEMSLPIAFINVGVGGSSIRDWTPDGRNATRLQRAFYLTLPYGARAVLWHQGESDRAMSSEDYYNRLKALIASTRSPGRPEIPWIVAQASYGSGTVSVTVRAAQARAWQTKLAWPGPDTDVLGREFREIVDNVHFNEQGTRAAAKLWVEAIHADAGSNAN